MQLVASFRQILQPLAAEFYPSTFDNLKTLLSGWVFAGRRTVTGMIVAAQAVNHRHHATFHRIFSRATWSLDALGLRVFGLALRHLPQDQPVALAIDDTLAHKRGPKVFGAGMHHDPQLSSRSKTVTTWGHSWVVLGLIVRLPFCTQRTFCLPILLRLYLNQKAADKARRVYRTRPQLAVQMMELICKHLPQRRFHVVADSAYGGKSVLLHLPENCDLTSRLPLDARLYGPVPERRPGTNGRPRKRGDRLASPEKMLDGRADQRMEIQIYGRREKARVVSTVARVYAAPNRPLRVVALEALAGGRGREVFYSTAVDTAAQDVLTHYADRWSIEVSFRDAKQSLGFEQPQGWSRRAVERTGPMAMLLYSLVLLWFAETGHGLYEPRERPWYRKKAHASFADMLLTLKRESVRQTLLQTPLSGPGSRKVMQILDTALRAAV